MTGQGFASKTPERRKEDARKGGQMAHRKGTAHQWTSETARAAALKGVAKRKARMTEKTPEPRTSGLVHGGSCACPACTGV